MYQVSSAQARLAKYVQHYVCGIATYESRANAVPDGLICLCAETDLSLVISIRTLLEHECLVMRLFVVRRESHARPVVRRPDRECHLIALCLARHHAPYEWTYRHVFVFPVHGPTLQRCDVVRKYWVVVLGILVQHLSRPCQHLVAEAHQHTCSCPPRVKLARNPRHAVISIALFSQIRANIISQLI